MPFWRPICLYGAPFAFWHPICLLAPTFAFLAPHWLLLFATKAVEPSRQCQLSIPIGCCFSVQRPLSHCTDANYAKSYPAPNLCMLTGQDLFGLFRHITFLFGGTPQKNWFHWTDYKLSSKYDWEVCWPAHRFHLSRTHDGDDEELSKDIVMGLQGCHVHIALSFCTLIGVVPWWNYSPWWHYSCLRAEETLNFQILLW